MDFYNGYALLELCNQEKLPISEIMRLREITEGNLGESDITQKLQRAYEIMKEAAHTPIHSPQTSIGGLIGGEAQKFDLYSSSHTAICGTALSKAIAYSLAVLEVNASMGLIVAAPTAGSSGVLPGVLIAAEEEFGFSIEQIHSALLNASAIGYLFMRNASVAGAEAGCQAEVGAASAMAASALTELFGGTPEICLEAASMAISNLLGLVCDPIAGLVEAPCQSRNTIGTANAFTCAQLALSGIKHPIPFDEMLQAMDHVGRCLPFELRETALGGNAGTPTGCSFSCKSKETIPKQTS